MGDLTQRRSRVNLGSVSVVRHIRRSAWGLAIGALVTAGVLDLHARGVFQRFELDMLDLRFRRFNRIQPSDLILHVDITDDALERIHRWPWPRRLHAELIATLKELGARAEVMDIAFPDRQPHRLPLPRADSADELAGSLKGLSAADVIFDDRDLAAAIAQAGEVYLPMFYDSERRGDPRRQLARHLGKALIADPSMSIDQVLAVAKSHQAAEQLSARDIETLCERIQVETHLAKRFAARAADLAKRTGIDRRNVDKILPGLKKKVARGLAQQIMARGENVTVDQLVGEVLPTEPRDPLDVRDVRAAYETERAIQAVLAGTVTIPTNRRRLYPSVRSITPAVAGLGEAAKDAGFVTYETTSLDGVLRSIPLATCYRGRMLRQLAFAALCDVLEVPPEKVEMAGPGRLVLRGARYPGETDRDDLVIPLNERGEFLLNWYADPERYGTYPSHERWRSSFKHIAVGRVLEIPRNRRALRAGRRRVRAAAVSFTSPGSANEQYIELCRARDRAERAAKIPSTSSQRSGRSRPTSQPNPKREPAETNKQITEIEDNAVAVIMSAREQIAGLEPESQDERREFQQIRLIAGELMRLDRLARRVKDRLTELRPIVEGKVCFIGYTATAQADFITTPLFDPAPGVVAHSNLFNTLYTGSLIRQAPRWSAVLLIVFCGLATTAITTWRGPIFSLLTAAIGLNVVVVTVAMWVFYQWRIWVIVPTEVVAVLASWALITVYRQLTEGREKRLAFSRLGQYTSPTLARRIAEDPRALTRAEVRDVTCYFSDLKGFTTISEGLGAERTQALLNVYLERMSEVLDRHEAFVNKFLGDGIFAFFNPAVNPQPNHVRLACESALDTITALDDLVTSQRESGGDEAFQKLRCRVGLASGPAVVGNCGSDRKFDYTCIGDTVNLAARLESANKAFGTLIMVARTTRDETGDLYEWRYLGGLRVVGKKHPVGVYEMLGRKGAVADDVLEYAARYEQGIQLFEQGNWVDCVTHFARMLARRPDDLGLTLYMDRCQEYQKFGKPDDWSGAIELTEK